MKNVKKMKIKYKINKPEKDWSFLNNKTILNILINLKKLKIAK
jgi:hypothetical protein